MNAYKQHGFTWGEVLDHSTFGPGRKQLGIAGRLAGNAFYLKQAAACRRSYTDGADAAVARMYIAKAREYREELALLVLARGETAAQVRQASRLYG